MYAVISDIHGNLDALEAVLADVPEGVGRIYCLGDVIGYGANPNECCDLVREMEMPLITGNHDLAVTDLSTDLAWFNPVAAAAVRWTREQLTEENATFLLSRPRMMQERGALFVHGSVRDPDEYIINSASARENLALLQAEYPGVHVCFFGHTHVKAVAPSPNGSATESGILDLGAGPHLVNPGSVGQPRDGDTFASYVLAENEPDGAKVAYRSVDYDIERAQARIRAAGLPGMLADRLAVGPLTGSGVEPSFDRLFTVEEANTLLPKLQEMLDDVAVHRDAMREKAPHMEPILKASAFNGGGKIGSEYGVEAYKLYLAVGRIRELGVVLKDLDMGLLDFPHERDGRVVFLCWHPPEERIEYWHEIEAGYAGRQPL